MNMQGVTEIVGIIHITRIKRREFACRYMVNTPLLIIITYDKFALHCGCVLSLFYLPSFSINVTCKYFLNISILKKNPLKSPYPMKTPE